MAYKSYTFLDSKTFLSTEQNGEMYQIGDMKRSSKYSQKVYINISQLFNL